MSRPIVAEEVDRIGSEAIRNACRHSGGTRVEVEIEFSSDLNLSVKDNGAGIPAEVLNGGRPGHFGIAGMRERAERIGARLSFQRAADGGTEVLLAVQGWSVPKERDTRGSIR